MALENVQYNKILHEYDARRLKNKHILDERITQIYEAIPQIKEIDLKIISGSIADAKLSLTENNTAFKKRKEVNQSLSKKKRELLLENGYPRNYLAPIYTCGDCKDTGHIGGRKCHCFKQAIVDFVYSQSNIKYAMTRENFHTFSYSYYSNLDLEKSTQLTPRDNAKKVVRACKNFISNFDSAYSNILLYGNTGVGKTFLVNCIAKELLDSAHMVIYLTAFQLFDILGKNAFGRQTNHLEAERQFAYILNCDLLIIDDLGTEINNTFVNSQLYLCINERHLRQKSTILSTNQSLDYLNNNYGERIFSRITGNYMILKIVGEDIRIKKKFKKTSS